MTVSDRQEPPPGFGDVRCPYCRVRPLERHLSDCPEPERVARLFAEQDRQRRRWTVKPIFAWYDHVDRSLLGWQAAALHLPGSDAGRRDPIPNGRPLMARKLPELVG